MNRLSLSRRTQIISALVEGNSIRSVERMTASALIIADFVFLGDCVQF